MTISQVILGDIRCDKCGAFLANIESPDRNFSGLSRLSVTCVACGGVPVSKGMVVAEMVTVSDTHFSKKA